MQKEGRSAQLSWAASILDRMAFEASGGSLYLCWGIQHAKTQRHIQILSAELKKQKGQHD